MRFVGLGVFDDFVSRELLAGFRFSRRIADHPGEITDQENHFMTQFLELFHFLNQHRVSQMEIGGRRIESRFDSERAPALELRQQ